MSNTQKPEDVREAVSEAYARAIGKAAGSCCAEAQECCPPAKEESSCCPSEASYAEKIGYGADELGKASDGAGETTFGCGNPLAFSAVTEGQTVVDLGSGAGLDLMIAAEKVGPEGHVIGVDMTDAMIEKARQNAAEAGYANIDVRRGIIEELPIDDGTVDWVISNCVINLSPEKPKVFAEIARVLQPGGEMLVSDVVVDDLPDWAREHMGLYSGCVAGATSEAEYVAGLQAAGLVDVEVRNRVAVPISMIEDGVGAVSDGEDAKRMAAELDGKVASIEVYAKKA